MASLLFASCAIRPTPTLNDFARHGGENSFEAANRRVPADAVVLDVPFDHQENAVACGAHVLASLVRYWRPEAASETGEAIFERTPPFDLKTGYSLAELIKLAHGEGLEAFGVKLQDEAVTAEIDKGRPVLAPLELPTVWIQTRTFFDPDFQPAGAIKEIAIGRIGSMSRKLNLAMGGHYVLIVGYSKDLFVLMDPIMGYRTIGRAHLEQFRKRYEDAALVFSKAA